MDFDKFGKKVENDDSSKFECPVVLFFYFATMILSCKHHRIINWKVFKIVLAFTGPRSETRKYL